MEALREEIYDHTSDPAQESFRNQQYQRSSMQRSAIVDRLRREGAGLQNRERLYWILFCRKNVPVVKENIFFWHLKKDPNIGMATVYRND